MNCFAAIAALGKYISPNSVLTEAAKCGLGCHYRLIDPTRKQANPFEFCNILFDNKLQNKESPIAIIPQRQLFSWKEIENLADLERFSLLLKCFRSAEMA